MDELKKQSEELLCHRFIEEGSFPYGAPVFFVKKNDGSLRWVCDWRALNKITVEVQACLPKLRSTNLLDIEGQSTFLSLT